MRRLLSALWAAISWTEIFPTPDPLACENCDTVEPFGRHPLDTCPPHCWERYYGIRDHFDKEGDL